MGVRCKGGFKLIELILVSAIVLFISIPFYVIRKQEKLDREREAMDYLALVEFLKSEQLNNIYSKTRGDFKDMPMKDKDGWTNIYKIED